MSAANNRSDNNEPAEGSSRFTYINSMHHQIELTDSFVARLKPKDKPFEVSDKLRPGLLLRVQPTGLKTYYLNLWSPDSAPRRQRYRWKIGEASTFKLYRTTPGKTVERDRSVRNVADELRAKARKVDLREERRAARLAQERNQETTLAGFIDHHYAQHYADQGNAQPMYMMRWLKNSFPDLMPMRMEDITHLTIRNWQKHASKRLADATIARLLALLAGALSRAVVERHLRRHPLQAAERKRHGLKLPKSEPRARYLNEAEEQNLLKTLEARDTRLRQQRARTIIHRERRGLEPPPTITGPFADHLTPLVVLALNTGIRRGALLGLSWEDIQNDSVHVRMSLDKAKKGYFVPLV